MADEQYCEVEDVTSYAVAQGALTNPAREVVADPAANTLVLRDHNLRRNAKLEFVAFPGGSLAGGLSPGVPYYAIPTASESRLQVAAAPNGVAVDLTTPGSRFGLVRSLRELIEPNIKAASQRLHLYLPAHAVPLIVGADGLYPSTARRIVAVWATHMTCVELGQRNALVQEEVDRLTDRELKLLLSGVPMRDTRDTTRRIGLSMSMGPDDARDQETIP